MNIFDLRIAVAKQIMKVEYNNIYIPWSNMHEEYDTFYDDGLSMFIGEVDQIRKYKSYRDAENGDKCMRCGDSTNHIAYLKSFYYLCMDCENIFESPERINYFK